ncbi:hypothetical protein MCOR22_009738, partial [Pyricularia oryzae]
YQVWLLAARSLVEIKLVYSGSGRSGHGKHFRAAIDKMTENSERTHSVAQNAARTGCGGWNKYSSDFVLPRMYGYLSTYFGFANIYDKPTWPSTDDGCSANKVHWIATVAQKYYCTYSTIQDCHYLVGCVESACDPE